MNKNIIITLIFITCAVLAGYFLRGCTVSPGVDSSDDVRDSLTRANRQLLEVNRITTEQYHRLLDKADKRDKEFKVTEAKKDREIAFYKSHPTVKEVRVAYPVVDTLIIAYDSAIFRRDLRLSEIKIERESERMVANMLIMNGEARNVNLTGINASLGRSQTALSRDLRRSQRWNKVYKFALPVVGAAGVYAGMRLAN